MDLLISENSQSTRNDLLRIMAVFLVALAVRGIALWLVSGVGIHFPKYPILAEQLKDNHFLAPVVFAYCPLYVYFLAFLLALTGGATFPILILQILYGSISAVLAYVIAGKMAGRKAALVAGLITAFSHSMVLHEVNLLADSLAVFIQLLLILVLLKAFEAPTTRRWAVAGLFLGLLVTLRPIFALALVGLVPAGWFLLRPSSGKQRARWLAVLAGVTLLVTLPITIQNFIVSGDLVPIVSQGGYVFYTANNYASPAVRYAPPPLLPMIANARTHENEDPIAFFDDALSVRIAGSIVPGLRRPTEVSRFYVRRALGPMARYPGHFARLFLNKAFAVVSAYEVHDTIETNAKDRPLSRIPLLPYGAVLGLGAIGLFVTRRRWRALASLYILGGTQIVSLLIFYVTPRFRLPLESILILFAALAVAWWLEFPRKRALPFFGCLAALSILSFVPRTEVMRLIDRDQKIQTALAESSLQASRGNLAATIPPLQRLIGLLDNPTSRFYLDAQRQLAEVYKRMGNVAGESAAAEKARPLPLSDQIRILTVKMEREGRNLRTLELLAEKYKEGNNWAKARELYALALDRAPADPTVRFRMAETQFSGGDFDRGVADLERALRDGLDFSRHGLAAHYHLWRFYRKHDPAKAELHREAFRRFLWIFDYLEPSSAEIRGMEEMELR